MINTNLLVAQLGARKHYQEPSLFAQWGILDTLYTDFYATKIPFAQNIQKSKIINYFPSLLKKGLERYEPSLSPQKVVHFPLLAYEYAHIRSKVAPQERAAIGIKIAKDFSQKIIKNNDFQQINVIYGFNSASLELFKIAKEKQIYCILDQTLAETSLVNKLMAEEEARWPGWSISPFKVDDANLEILQREQQEQELADRIICGSDFVKQSLITKGIAADKIKVVALGRQQNNPLSSQNSIVQSLPKPKNHHELRILFAGAVGLRKGIPYLLEALRSLKGKISFTCKIAGRWEINSQYLQEYSDVCEFLGLVPRSQMETLYQWADVFVLPSICEGSAMVTYEALCWGIPLITTPNSGSIVRDRVDGFIIPIRSSEAIANKLIAIARGNWQINNSINVQEYLQQVNDSSQAILFNTVTNFSK